MEITAKTNISDVFKNFAPDRQLKFQRAAFDRTVRIAGKETKKRIISKYNLKSKDVKITVKTSKHGLLVGYLIASPRFLALTRFNPIKSMQGITVSVIRGVTAYIEGAFIEQPHGVAYGRGQGSTVTLKRRELFKRKSKNAYPLAAKDIKEQHSMSVGEYLKSDENMRAIREMMNRERPNIERAVVDAFTKKQIKSILGRE